MTTTPRTIAVTGAAGMLGYSLLFRLGVGRSLGATAPIKLRLLELPDQMQKLEGIVMELDDCAFPMVESVDIFDDPYQAFEGANAALLVGAHARKLGMERSDLLEANAPIFATQGRALNEVAADDVRVIVVGNPVNTNTLIAAHHAPDLPPERFTALMRLDHNRTAFQVARKAGVPVAAVRNLIMWGNHSRTLFPDIAHATIGDRRASDLIADDEWARDFLIPKVADRGGAVLAARGASSQGSAANAVIGQLRDWYLGTEPGDWTSAGIWSHGEYGIPAGLVSSFPVTSDGTAWHIVPNLELDDFSRARIAATVSELLDEREHARNLGFLD